MSKTPDKALKKVEEAKRNYSSDWYLTDCELTQFPPEILELTNLTELRLTDNYLTTVPEAIGNLTKLTELQLYDNQFQVGAEIYKLPPKEQIQEILKWQRAQRAGTLQPIHEAKVIFI